MMKDLSNKIQNVFIRMASKKIYSYCRFRPN